MAVKDSDEGKPEGEEADVSLDMSQAAVKKMIADARERGYITYDQLNTVMPPEQVSSEQIEDVMAMLSEMGINVIDDEEIEEGAEPVGELVETASTSRDVAVVTTSAEALDRTPRNFSGGQRQRLGIARALAVEPRFIVADEPVSAVDVSVQAQILNLLLDLRGRLGLTLLFIAHDLSVVRYLSDRVGVMYLGRIVESGTRDQMFGAARHPYTQALLRAAPRPDPSRKGSEAAVRGEPPSPLAPPPGCHFHTRCPLATDLCRSTAPAPETLAPGHVVRCHHHAQTQALI